MDDEDSLVRRRSRRSTAGNRMEAALAEMHAAGAEEAEDDVDFEIPAGTRISLSIGQTF